MELDIRSLASALGAEIRGVDLSRPVDDATARFIAVALSEHGVLVFRDQPISDNAHVQFARHFGELQTFDEGAGQPVEIFRAANMDRAGSLLPVGNERAKLLMLNWLWHIDSSYRDIPVKGVVLHAIEVGSDGGDTVFANLWAAHEALPVAMKDRIAGLVARHSFKFLVTSRGLPPLSEEELAHLRTVEHPLVRQNPDGRKSLYLSPPYMETFTFMSQPESLALIAELTEWASQDRFVYQHRWRPHDILMWDNGWTMHRVTPYDLASDRRVMHGATIIGTEPIRPIGLSVPR